jgi:nucleoid-associated protein YgaU
MIKIFRNPQHVFTITTVFAIPTMTLLMAMNGCSVPNTKRQTTNDSSFQATSSADLIPAPVELVPELSNYSAQDPTPKSSEPPLEASLAPTLAPVLAPVPAPAPASAAAASTPTDTISAAGNIQTKADTLTYVIKRSDTLMKISFENLGNLLRWKEIYSDNKDKIGNPNSLQIGTSILIHLSNPIRVDKNGEPYLIRPRDTLFKISDKLYGTIRKWKALWENNLQLIHDPNRIYAGFYLYYLSLEAAVKATEVPKP